MNISKSSTSSPAKYNKTVKKTVNSATPKNTKTSPTLPTSESRTSVASSFFKPTTLTPAKLQSTQLRDQAIYHESRIFKTLLDAAQKKQEAKRNPILQNNEEAVQEFKPCIRRLASAEKGSECRDETFSRTRMPGEFNYIYNPPCQNPRPQGVKMFTQLPSESQDENQRRLRKSARTNSLVGRNPITEGDVTSEVIKRSRGAGVQCDHQQKLNDKKHFLPSELKNLGRGQVFRQMTLTLGDCDYADNTCVSERLQTAPSRPLTTLEQKMRGSIRGILEYEDGPNFRDQSVTPKCNTTKFSDVLGGLDNERIFARKSTLAY